MEPAEKVYRSKRDIVINNFLGGISWSLGTLIGASVILAIFGYFLSQINLVPIIGEWLSQIVGEAQKNIQPIR